MEDGFAQRLLEWIHDAVESRLGKIAAWSITLGLVVGLIAGCWLWWVHL